MQFCASPGPLQGGPKDEDPPVFLGSEPVQFSTNQKPRKILMEFDEFLVLKDVNQNVIVSPPLNENPDFKTKGKKVQVKNDKDVLWEENTTYTYFFGDAICDLHEENPIHNFEFVFSTGSEIDSLSLRGKILQAQYLIPEEAVYVCLYKKGMNDTIPFDSLPYLVRPYYIARTNELGEFQINNLRYDEYMMFAVKDVNSNYFFDLPNEEIAFLDSMVYPQEVFEFIPDTIPVIPGDTALMDSLWKHHSYTMVQNPMDIFMFLQDDSVARLKETAVTLNKKIEFFFNYPFRDSLKIELLNDSIASDWYIKEFSANKDSLTLWLKEIPNDTIEIKLMVDTIQADTLQFVIKEEAKKKEDPRRKRKKAKDNKKQKKEKEVIQYTTNVKNSLPFYTSIKIKFETPLVYTNFDYALLKEDTVVVTPQFTFSDSLKRNLKIEYEWKENTKYELVIPQDALRDLFDKANDSISLKFTTTEADSYGNIDLQIEFDSLFKAPFLIQLVQGEAEKEKLIRSYKIHSDSNLQIKHISEGDYYLKAIEDQNNNGRWNSGHFGLRQQAEQVFYFPLPLSIKEGWDIEDVWKISTAHRQRPEKLKKKKDE
jgi:hypothetical protein